MSTLRRIPKLTEIQKDFVVDLDLKEKNNISVWIEAIAWLGGWWVFCTRTTPHARHAFGILNSI